MNVKNRTLLLVSLIIIFLTGFYLYEGVNHYNSEIDLAVLEQEKLIDSITDDFSEYAFGQYRLEVSRFVSQNQPVRESFAARDRNVLLHLTKPIFTELHEENKYFHAMDFNLPDGEVFLRVQKPELWGDNILETREIIGEVHKNKEQVSGFDIGKHGAIYWVAEPVFYNGEYVGAVEFGIEAKQLEQALAKTLESDVTSVLRAREWQKADFVKKGFHELDGYILMTRGNTLFDKIPELVDFARAGDQQVSLGGREYMLHSCAILTDFRGESIGRIVLFQDLTEQVNRKKEFIVHALLISLSLLFLSFIILYYSFGLLIGRLEKSSQETREAKEELEAAHDKLELKVEERTAELVQTNDALKEEIHERRKAETKYAEQGEFLKSIIESLTHPFYVIDVATHVVVLANTAACKFMGGQSFQGLTCYSLTHGGKKPCSGEEHPCPLEQVMETREPVKVEHVHYDQQQNPHVFEIYAYPLFNSSGNVSQVVEYAIDVTFYKKAEEEKDRLREQLLAAQKMEAVGILAGGVAHDFNNILTTVLGYSQIMVLRLDEKDPMRNMVEEIYGAAERAAGLTRQLLAFSRKQDMEMKLSSLNGIVENISKMLGRLIGEDIEMSFSYAESIGTIKADIGQIEQVLMNLAVNARDAMPHGGKLRIETREVELDKEYAESRINVRPGSYAMLSVTDTGEGMTREVQEKIFEPFFTTKKRDRGTGLGLATVYGIVKQHDGHIYVYSEPGRGTTFKIYIPIAGEAIKLDEGIEDGEGMPQGTELIMVVDDDEAIRRLVRDTLEPLGYRLLEAESGEEALEMVAHTNEQIDLVLSDLVMQGMNGQQLVNRLEQDYPNMTSILMSGYTDDIIIQYGVSRPKVNFIGKPLLPISLARKIREILDKYKDNYDTELKN